jgi:GNAT superfamily N-acetyltransferase
MLSSEEKRSRLQKALDYGGNTHDLADVIDLVRKGEAQFWENGDGTIITEVQTFPRLKAINFWLVSGTVSDCMALEDDILDWAKAEGCTMALSTGRKGWMHYLSRTGWRPRPHMHPAFKPLVED